MTTNVTQAQNATASLAGQSDAAKGLALVRVTVGAMFVWVFFENLGKGAYTPAGYAGVINYYIKNSHAPGRMEVGSRVYVESCGHGRARASGDGDLRGNTARYWPAHAPGCPYSFSVPWQPLGHGIGYVLDLGTPGSRARIAGTRGGTRRSRLGHRRIAGTATPRVPVVVIREPECEYRSSFLPITKRRPLAVCLPICLPISSRRSSLSTAIRRTERPISPERWGHSSSRSPAEDMGALV